MLCTVYSIQNTVPILRVRVRCFHTYYSTISSSVGQWEGVAVVIEAWTIGVGTHCNMDGRAPEQRLSQTVLLFSVGFVDWQ